MVQRAHSELETGVAFLDNLGDAPKVTFFGSARIGSDHPAAVLARSCATAFAAHGWFCISGGGPGVMEATAVGAGPEFAVGIGIELAGEEVNDAIDVRNRFADTAYFFTRKVLLTRSSTAFVALPGGIGTLDEVFEVLNLLLTGKTQPAPLVLLDVPGGTYWSTVVSFLESELVAGGYVRSDLSDCFQLASSVDEVLSAVTGFHQTFASCHYDGRLAHIRMRSPLTSSQRDILTASGLPIDVLGELPEFDVSLPDRAYPTLRRLLTQLSQADR